MRRGWAAIFALGLLVLLAAFPAGAAAPELVVRGRVLGPGGEPVAGAVISDEHGITLSRTDGGFSLTTRAGRVISLTAPAGLRLPGRWWWPAGRAAEQPLRVRLEPAPPGRGPLLALISDPHLFSAQAPPRRRVPWRLMDLPMRVWQGVAEALKQKPPALTLVSGDFCADADKGDARHAEPQLRLAAQALEMLPAPARALPGNHDALYRDARGRRGVYLGLWRRHLGPARHLSFAGKVAVIAIDNLGQGRGLDHRQRSLANSPNQVREWLRAVLAILPLDTPVVLASHHPLLSPLSGYNPLRPYKLVRTRRRGHLALRDLDQQAGAILAMLKGRRVLAILHGHEHTYHRSTIFTRSTVLPLLAVPALCGGWWQGDRDWGAYQFPPGYLIARMKEGRLLFRFVEVKLK